MLVGEGQEKKANVPAQSTWKTSSTYPWTSNCGLLQRHVLFESDLQITRLSWSANRAAKDLAEASHGPPQLMRSDAKQYKNK
jgi:hypothetical protein